MILCFVPKHNEKKADAQEFKREAVALCTEYERNSYRIVEIDNHKRQHEQRREIISRIQIYNPTTIAFFCHGYNRGIQLGFNRPGTIEKLADTVCEYTDKNSYIKLLFFCCNVARLHDQSFCGILQNYLCSKGRSRFRIIGHTTAGHTTKNPYVMFFESWRTDVGGIGGLLAVGPNSELWDVWKEALKKNIEGLRYSFFKVTIPQLHTQLKQLNGRR